MRYSLLAATFFVPVMLAAQQPTDSAKKAEHAREHAQDKGKGRMKSGPGKMGHHKLVAPDDVKWGAAPAALPPGAEVAVISGDPSKGGIFTMRIRMPDGYRIMPHFHSADEHVTVIKGKFNVALGSTWQDGQGTALEEGGFAVMSAGTRHYVWADGSTIVQVHAKGPWKLTYVNRADDPRTKATR